MRRALRILLAGLVWLAVPAGAGAETALRMLLLETGGALEVAGRQLRPGPKGLHC